MNGITVDTTNIGSQYYEQTFRVLVTGGQLTVDMTSGYNWDIINELEIKPADANVTLPTRTQISPAGESILLLDVGTVSGGNSFAVRKSGSDLQVVNSTSGAVLASAATCEVLL